MLWSSHYCNDRRYSYFTRNIWNGCVGSFKIHFGASSEVCSAIVTTIWRPGCNLLKSPIGLVSIQMVKATFQEIYFFGVEFASQ